MEDNTRNEIVELKRLFNRVSQAVYHGNVSKARKALVSKPLPTLNQTKIEQIRQKYPQSTEVIQQIEDTIPADLLVNEDQLFQYVFSFKRGAAKSAFGFCTDDLQNLYTYEPSSVALHLKFINKIARGMITDNLSRTSILTSRGVALSKNETSVRPIGIEDPTHKCCAHLLAKQFENQLHNICGPFQFGNAKSCGLEKLVLTIKTTLELEPQSIVVATDISNAFNSVNRSCILRATKTHIPELFPYAQFLLAKASNVIYNDYDKNTCLNISNNSGVSQGNPISPFLFNLVQAEALQKTRDEHPSVKIYSFHDDHFLIGDVNVIPNALETLSRNLAQIGLNLSMNKTTIWSSEILPDEFITYMTNTNIKIIPPSDGIIAVGCPIGSTNYIQRHCTTVAKEICDQLKLMRHLVDHPTGISIADVQTLFTLTRQCIPQQYNYILRTCSPTLSHQGAQLLDNEITQFIFHITKSTAYLSKYKTNIPSLQHSVNRLFTKIKNGGMGITSATRTADIAYISSIQACSQFVMETLEKNSSTLLQTSVFNDAKQLIDQYNHCYPNIFDNIHLFQKPEYKLQHKLNHGIEDKYKSDLTASLPMSQPGNGHRITHLNSQDLAVSVQGLANTDPLASAWLTVNPIYDLNKMSDATFNTAFHTRMMFPVMQSRKYCTCGATIDSMGSHFLTCPSMHVRSKMRNPAHKQLARALRTILSRQGKDNITVITQEPAMKEHFQSNQNNSTNENIAEKRADVEIIQNDNQKHLIIDVTMSDPTSNYVQPYKLQKAADSARKIKSDYYSKHFKLDEPIRNSEFHIFAIETTGIMDKMSKKFN